MKTIQEFITAADLPISKKCFDETVFEGSINDLINAFKQYGIQCVNSLEKNK